MAKANRDVLLLTCSMRRDLPLFDLLARSVDRWVDPRIRHMVVVPQADLAAFSAYGSHRREIVAQEDVWRGTRILKLPVPNMLSQRVTALRRPIYLTTASRKPVRGWMLQQLIKMEVSRAAPEATIMHMDSDAAFFRAFAPEDAFADGVPRIFGAKGETGAIHRRWIEVCAGLLGIETPADFDFHFVENCVVWDTATVRALLERIEEHHQRPFYKLLFTRPTFSEYQLYGLFLHSFPTDSPQVVEPQSFCNSFWPTSDTTAFDIEAAIARMVPKHCAVAMQSTHSIPLEERRRVIEEFESRFG